MTSLTDGHSQRDGDGARPRQPWLERSGRVRRRSGHQLAPSDAPVQKRQQIACLPARRPGARSGSGRSCVVSEVAFVPIAAVVARLFAIGWMKKFAAAQ
jgi:hypothetical protein